MACLQIANPWGDLRDICGAVLVNKDRTGGEFVLLIHQMESGKWGIPKGAREEGETRAQCVIRELVEEIRLYIHPIYFVGREDENFHVISLNLPFENFQLKVCQREVDSYMWTPKHQLKRMLEDRQLNLISSIVISNYLQS